MCGYAFEEKPAPAPFRTMFTELAQAVANDCGGMTLTEQAAVNTLPDFPEAYRAFLAEVERLQALGERAP